MEHIQQKGELIAPYRYRIFPALSVRLITLTGLSPVRSYVVFNVGCAVLAALLFSAWLERLNFHPYLSTLGGVLLVSSVSITRTACFPMLEPAAMLCSVVLFIAVWQRARVLFLIACVLAIATKEVFVLFGLVWFCVHRDWRLALWPVGVFVVLRLVLGGSPLEVGYYNLLDGLPPYGARLLTLGGAARIALKVFLAFCFLWAGLWPLRKDRIFSRMIVIVPVTILAAVFGSSHIIRVLGILAPLVIVGFLRWIMLGSEVKEIGNYFDGMKIIREKAKDDSAGKP